MGFTPPSDEFGLETCRPSEHNDRRATLISAVKQAEAALEAKDPKLAMLIRRLGFTLLGEIDMAMASLCGAYGVLARQQALVATPPVSESILPPPPSVVGHGQQLTLPCSGEAANVDAATRA